MVVGGYAVALHGHPRYTRDIDVWIEMCAENASNVVRALDQFGFGSLELREADFLTPGQVMQLGQPPNRIALLCTASAVSFADCYESRVTVEVDGVPVNFISLKDLRKNKAASGRHQDLADLENLE